MARNVVMQGVLTERDLNEEIAKVAYELFQKRGKTSGYDFEDWLKAEKIVMEKYAKLEKEETDEMSAITNKIVMKKRTRKTGKTAAV